MEVRDQMSCSKRWMSMIGIVAVFVSLFATSSFAQANPITYYGCLSPGGTLSRVTIGTAPECPVGQPVISWNHDWVAGSTGSARPAGRDGRTRSSGSKRR